MGFINTVFNRLGIGGSKSDDLHERRFNMALQDRLTSSWVTSPITIDQDMLSDHITVVARARDLAKNDDYVRGYLHEVEKNVIGVAGIQYIPDPRYTNGRRDVEAAKALTSAWSEWSKKGVCDVTGKWSWLDIEKLVAKACERDGEAILVDYPGFKGNKFKYAVQFIDCLQLDANYNTKLENGNEIVLGVEVNALRRPIAYHFLNDEISAVIGSTMEGRKRTRIPAERVHHIYHPEFAHQTRGFSQFVSSARNLKLIDGYSEAVVTSARVAAATSTIMNRNAQNGGYQGDKSSANRNIKYEPGTIYDLPFEATISQLKAEQPTTTMPTAIKTWLQRFAAGIGLSYHTVGRDLSGVNYTSSRTGELSDRDKWRGMHRFYATHCHASVNANWLRSALINRAIPISNSQLSPVKYHKYCACNWQGRGWEWTDPSKAQKAEKAEIDDNRRSPLDAIRARGHVPETVIEDIKEWHEMLANAGLSPTIEPIVEKPAPGAIAGDEDKPD